MKKFTTLFFFVLTSLVHATTVSGTINFEGAPLNGFITVQLAYPGTTGTQLNLNGGAHPVKHTVTNGVFTPLTVTGNDTLQPRGTYYLVTYYDSSNAPILRAPYVISGATYNLGQALPTPITTANVNFQDLLGLRNVSVQNLTVSNSMQFGTGAIISQSGLSGAQFVNSIVFAQYFQTASTTCGLQEAYNALPANGGWIIAPPGACTMVSTFTINKPLLLTGYGTGSTADNVNNTTYFAGTQLINGSVSQSSIVIGLTTAQQVLGGVTIRDLALIGNGSVTGSTTGSGIAIIGGTAATSDLHDITLNNLLLYGFKGNGLDIFDKVSRVNISNVQSIFNAQQGIAISQTQSLVGASDININQSNISFNANVNVLLPANSTKAGTIRITNSTISGGATAGIYVDLASSARLDAIGNTIESNAQFEIFLGGGIGHTIERNRSINVVPGTIGIYVGPSSPTPAGSLSASLKDNDFENHTPCDYYSSANATNLLFYNQAKAPGSTGVLGCFNGTTIFPVMSNTPGMLVNTTATDSYLLNQSTASCGLAGGSTDAGCSGTVAITTQPNNGYEVFLQPISTAGAFLTATVISKSTSSFSYSLSCTFNCSTLGTVTMDVHVHHP